MVDGVKDGSQNIGFEHTNEPIDSDNYTIPPAYDDLLEDYTTIIKQVYTLPDSWLWIPLVDAKQSIWNKVKIPVFPLSLSKMLVKSHIRRRLSYINNYFNLQLLCFESDRRCKLSKSEKDKARTHFPGLSRQGRSGD